MAKPTSQGFEWQILDGEALPDGDVIWESDVAPRPVAPPRLAPAIRQRLLWWVQIIALGILVGGGGWLWWRLRQQHEMVRRDVQQVVGQELLAWQAGDESAFAELLDEERSGWRQRELRRFNWLSSWYPDSLHEMSAAVEEVTLVGDKAEAQVRYQQGGDGPAFRETLFFRQAEGRWLRSAPESSRWGPEQSTETRHFRFVYRARDAEAVQALIPEVERFYLQLRHDLGLETSFGVGDVLAETQGVERLEIVVVPDTDIVSWGFVGNRLELPSPELVRAQADLPLSLELKRLLARPLTDRLVGQRLLRKRPTELTGDLLHAISHWEAETWSGAGVSWWWLAEQRLLQRAREDGVDLRPTVWMPDEGESRRITHARNFFLVDYIATTYGRDRIAPLLRALQVRSDWEYAATAGLGVPYSEFLAGWEAYLARLDAG